MGCDYYPYAIIGVRVRALKQVGTERVRWHGVCWSHDADDPVAWRRTRHVVPDVDICPFCGDKTYRDTPVYERVDNLPEEYGCKIGEYDIKYHDEYFDPAYIGLVVPETDKNEKYIVGKIPDDMAAFKERLRQTLEPLGLWNESTFGLHAMLVVSC